MKGLLLVDKPAGVTSHDVVDRVRKAAGIRRIGHTGTLDPAATGLLVLCLGPATRLSEHLTYLDKVYEGSMELGVVTDSYDRDGAVIETHPVPVIDEAAVHAIFSEFTGEIMQIPPMVSAVKVGGERLYKKARKGEVVEREARPVLVREFALLGMSLPFITFRVACSRGTYVRSLCHEVGQRLGCGATLASLRRTRVGHHEVGDAAKLDELLVRDDVVKRLIPMDEALSLPVALVTPDCRQRIVSGAGLAPKDVAGKFPVQADWVQIKSTTGELLALGQVKIGSMGAYIHPKRVLCD